MELEKLLYECGEGTESILTIITGRAKTLVVHGVTAIATEGPTLQVALEDLHKSLNKK